MAYSTLPGRIIHGRYRLERGLGRGASAEVYQALDLELDRRVAVKLVHPGLAGDDRFVRRFQAEARAVAALNHPNIVQIHDWGREDGQPFLVLEYLAGGSLRDLLRRGAPLGTPEVARLGAQTAHGLNFAHRTGIVHRDIKPANLLFDDAGDAHITDFGLARAMADATLTEHIGTVFGTARYASPEQATGENVGSASDVYSLGIVCYEALVGEAPFAADTPLAMLMARTQQPLPLPPELGPLTEILRAATAIDPRDRIDAGEFARALDEIGETLPPAHLTGLSQRPGALFDIEADPPTVLGLAISLDEPTIDGRSEHDPTTVLAAPIEDELPQSRARRSARRRSRWLRAAVATGIVLVLVAVGSVLFVQEVVYGHTVPKLEGLTLASASKVASRSDVVLASSRLEYSASVPAGEIVTQSLSPGTHVRANAKVGVVVSHGHAPVTLPTLAGLTSAAASSKLSSLGLIAHAVPTYNETVAAGTVISASPASGSVSFGSTVQLAVSAGPQPRTIPDLGGLSYAAAHAQITALRLIPKLARTYSTTTPAGEVVSSQPAFGATGIPVGSTVTVVVSRGPQLIAVPNVTGSSVQSAVATLQAAGLSATEVIGPPFATTVSATDPPPGTLVQLGTNITLYSV
jgi:eukaryotic-like serine/threonine-protein kinase